MHDFFFISFSLTRICFLYFVPPPPDKFSNGPSLRDLGAASQSYRNCSEITVVMCEQEAFPVWF